MPGLKKILIKYIMQCLSITIRTDYISYIIEFDISVHRTAYYNIKTNIKISFFLTKKRIVYKNMSVTKLKIIFTHFECE